MAHSITFTKLLLVSLSFLLSSNMCSGSRGEDLSKYFVSSSTPIDPKHPWQSIAEILLRPNWNPGTTKTTPQMIEMYGYPSETHKVITEDGYILSLHRIPHGRHEFGRRSWGKPVVFLQHGLFQSSYEWFMNKPENLLALRLADSGYDVWLGNARGTFYSRSHVKYTTRDREFWQFSMTEIGKYDLPAATDYVLHQTQQQKIFYIGSSKSCSEFWIMMSFRPEYNTKFRLMIGFAPVAYLQNIVGIVRFAAPLERFVLPLLELFFRGQFLPPLLRIMYTSLFTVLCSNKYLAETLCINYIFLQAGWSLPQQEVNQLPLFYSHSPAPVSVRMLSHLGQFINTGEFKEYDFGRANNLVIYGSPCPPTYFLNRTTVPTAIFYSASTDAVVEGGGVQKIIRELPNVVFAGSVNTTYWNHYDYHMAKEINQLVNDNVLRLLSLF